MDVDGKGFFIRVYQRASVVQSYIKHGGIVAWVGENGTRYGTECFLVENRGLDLNERLVNRGENEV